MPEDKPIVYILRGDDREKIEAVIRQFFEQLGDANMAEMNTTRLDGKSADLNDLRAAGLALPFLAERRMVIVEDALQKYVRVRHQKGDDSTLGEGENSQLPDKIALFLAFLAGLPPSTALVLVVPDQRKSRKRNDVWETDWVSLNDKHWLIQWAKGERTRAAIIDCALPTEREMARWIGQKAQELSGDFSPQACLVLAQYVGNDTQRAVQEINKLLTYVNFKRQVTQDDVELLCMNEQQASVFDMVDAMGQRDGKTASRLFHQLLEDMDFTYDLFPLVIRQFRFLIQAREMLDMGGTRRDLYGIPGLLPFLVPKIFDQAQKFNLAELEKIHHHLLQIDLGEKTGRIPGEIALDILIAQLSTGLPL
ncbi:MAG: DNA polymerase III subunit delta [Brevefilum sp.]|nr:DNA polymerase III subunit delta [Brevefilum sp.]